MQSEAGQQPLSRPICTSAASETSNRLKFARDRHPDIVVTEKLCGDRVELQSSPSRVSSTSVDNPLCLSGVRSSLESLVERSDVADTVAEDSCRETAHFRMTAVPKITIADYLTRLRTHLPVDASFILALVYISRIQKCVAITSFTWLRLLITAITVASKFIDDEEDVHYNNAFYAKLGGLSVTKLDELEIHFLKLLQWRLFVTEAEYAQYHQLTQQSAMGC